MIEEREIEAHEETERGAWEKLARRVRYGAS
jgi:hypothetical protein